MDYELLAHLPYDEALTTACWQRLLNQPEFWQRHDSYARRVQGATIARLFRVVFQVPMPYKCTRRDVRYGRAQANP